MGGADDSSWTRALMASSGIALGHDNTPRHASPDWLEAAAPETPLARLQKLAQVKDPEVREVVARRHDCPMGLLATLAHDRSSDVRAGVAGNPRITQAVADHLAKDKESRVLKALARNLAIDLGLLESLALHRREEVRRVASRQLDERVHGADAHAVRPDAAAALSRRSLDPDLPFELRDRVEPAAAWEAQPGRQPGQQWGQPRQGPGPRFGHA